MRNYPTPTIPGSKQDGPGTWVLNAVHTLLAWGGTLSRGVKHGMLEVDGRSMAGVAQAAVLHDGRRGVSQRHVILMTAAGRCKDSIAADLGCSPSTVDNVRKRYRERGLAGLKRRKPPGPKPRATAEYRAALRQAVQTPPQTLGFGFSVWPLRGWPRTWSGRWAWP